MAKIGKRYVKAAGRPSQAVVPRGEEGHRPRQGRRQGPSSTRPWISQCGSAWIPKHADQMVRGTVVLPHGTGRRCGSWSSPRARRKKRRRRQGPISWAPRTWSRRSREAGSISMRAVATPDIMGSRRKAGQGSRSPRPDAQPQDRHRHLRRGQGDQGDQGPAKSSTAWKRRASCMFRSARHHSRHSSSRTTPWPFWTPCSGPSPLRAKGGTFKGCPSRPPWARGFGSTPTPCRPW